MFSLLQEAFLGQVTQSHSQYHCQLRFEDLLNSNKFNKICIFRNDILVVVSLIISLKPDAPGSDILRLINLIELFFL
jgi:hypothetical protein